MAAWLENKLYNEALNKLSDELSKRRLKKTRTQQQLLNRRRPRLIKKYKEQLKASNKEAPDVESSTNISESGG